MEHRLYPRNNDNFEITLSNPRYGSFDAQVHDISQEGIAVRLHDMPFPTGTLVEVEIPTEQQQRFRNHDLKGYVVHAKEGEIGLWLLEPNKLFRGS